MGYASPPPVASPWSGGWSAYPVRWKGGGLTVAAKRRRTSMRREGGEMMARMPASRKSRGQAVPRRIAEDGRATASVLLGNFGSFGCSTRAAAAFHDGELSEQRTRKWPACHRGYRHIAPRHVQGVVIHRWYTCRRDERSLAYPLRICCTDVQQ
jgi:hypothetical protein